MLWDEVVCVLCRKYEMRLCVCCVDDTESGCVSVV